MSERTVIELVGVLFVFAGAYFTARFTASAAASAAATTREVGIATVDATREDRFIERLENRLRGVEEDAAACNARVEDQRRVIYAMQDRIAVLERASMRDQELIAGLRQFARELIRLWPKPGQPFTSPPDPPAGLLLEEEEKR